LDMWDTFTILSYLAMVRRFVFLGKAVEGYRTPRRSARFVYPDSWR